MYYYSFRPMVLLFSICLVVLILMLSSCASYSVAYKADDGRIYHCDTFGFGLLGAPLAVYEQHKCERTAESKGFEKIR